MADPVTDFSDRDGNAPVQAEAADPPYQAILRANRSRRVQYTGCCGAEIFHIPLSNRVNDAIEIAPNCSCPQVLPPTGSTSITECDIANLRPQVQLVDRHYSSVMWQIRDDFKNDMAFLLASTFAIDSGDAAAGPEFTPEVAREATDTMALRLVLKYKARMHGLGQNLDEDLRYVRQLARVKGIQEMLAGNAEAIRVAAEQHHDNVCPQHVGRRQNGADSGVVANVECQLRPVRTPTGDRLPLITSCVMPLTTLSFMLLLLIYEFYSCLLFAFEGMASAFAYIVDLAIVVYCVYAAAVVIVVDVFTSRINVAIAINNMVTICFKAMIRFAVTIFGNTEVV